MLDMEADWKMWPLRIWVLLLVCSYSWDLCSEKCLGLFMSRRLWNYFNNLCLCASDSQYLPCTFLLLLYVISTIHFGKQDISCKFLPLVLMHRKLLLRVSESVDFIRVPRTHFQLCFSLQLLLVVWMSVHVHLNYSKLLFMTRTVKFGEVLINLILLLLLTDCYWW